MKVYEANVLVVNNLHHDRVWCAWNISENRMPSLEYLVERRKGETRVHIIADYMYATLDIDVDVKRRRRVFLDLNDITNSPLGKRVADATKNIIALRDKAYGIV